MTDTTFTTLRGGTEVCACAPPSLLHGYLASFATQPSSAQNVPCGADGTPSPVFRAFSDLTALLDEAIAAEERLAQPWSWDLAMGLITVSDEDALSAVLVAAEALVRLPRTAAGDHALAAAAHFIGCGLALESAGDRCRLISALREAHPIFLSHAQEETAQRAAALIAQAIDRLSLLFAALDDGGPDDTPEAMSAVSIGVPAP